MPFFAPSSHTGGLAVNDPHRRSGEDVGGAHQHREADAVREEERILSQKDASNIRQVKKKSRAKSSSSCTNSDH